MPRQRRDWEPGDILSVVGRAHEGRPIFVTDDDRRHFVERLVQVFVPPDADLVAWAILINHYHLVVRVRDAAPGTLFLRFNTVIARRERRRRGDHGAVFQDRFWSRPCGAEGLVPLLTYVMGNPAHHGVVPTATALETYAWSAYPEVLGRRPCTTLDAAATLALVHPDPALARDALRGAMAVRVAAWQAERAGIDRCDEPGCTGEREGCPLVHVARPRGRSAAETAPAPPPRRPSSGISRAHDLRRDRLHAWLAGGRTAPDILAAVCARTGADPALVAQGARTHPESRARAVVAHVACDGLGLPVTSVAALVAVTGTAVTAARRRGRDLLAADGRTIDDVLGWTPPG